MINSTVPSTTNQPIDPAAVATPAPGTRQAAALATPAGVNRVTALTATVALVVAVLFVLFALPARAATTNDSTIGNAGGSGVGTPQTQHPVASEPTGSSGGVLFGGLCLAGIVATAGGVLWYTVRTRRTLESDSAGR
jgi:hypothetical protein